MENKETSGEDLIADFLEEKGIKFKRYQKIPTLQNDDKYFRESDFYLPDYDVYMEFLGQWNDTQQRNRYRQKMAVYHKNNIGCIYLWPDNLGTLEWMFQRRLREVLLKYNRLATLLKFEFNNYFSEYVPGIFLLIALIYYIDNTIARIAISALLLWTSYKSIEKYVTRLLKIKKSKWVSGANYAVQDEKG